MSSLLGLPCKPPPTFQSIFFPLGDFFSPNAFLHADTSMSRLSRFWYSRVFMLVYIWFVLFRLPREMSQMVTRGLNVSLSLVLIPTISFLVTIWRSHGHECTLFVTVTLYLAYFFLLRWMPWLSTTPVGNALPSLKDAPAASETPGLNNCRRLAVCRASPVYDNHAFQKGKYERCVECAKDQKTMYYDSTREGCDSSHISNDPKKCYVCHEGEVSINATECAVSREDCATVYAVMDIIDPPTRATQRYPNRTDICTSAKGSLCWFAEEGSVFRGWTAPSLAAGWSEPESSRIITSLDDAAGNGKGYPTKQVCERESGKTCHKLTSCSENSDMLARCACDQYRDTPKYENPCAFLEDDCDMTSIAYSEAVAKMNQAKVDVSDIVTYDDVDNFINVLDRAASSIP